MKRTVLFLIVFALVLGGCVKAPEPVETTALQPTTQPPATTQSPTEDTAPLYTDYEAPMISFTAAPVARDFTGSSGNTVMTYRGQSTELLTLDPQVSETVTLDLLNLTDYDATAAPRFLKEAREAFASGVTKDPYSFSLRSHCARLDSTVFSLVLTQVTSGANARANVTTHSATYDLITGRTMSLKDILIPGYSAPELSEAIVNSLDSLAKAGQLYSDYAYVIGELFTSNTQASNWYISDEGLCFYFAPYEIAPYNLGFVTATVPYEALKGLLRDEYYPEESVGLMGKVICRAGSDWEGFSQFCELPLDTAGEDWTLCTEGSVEDLRLEMGSFHDGSFTAETTLFACAALCSSDALLIQASREDLDSLTVTYVTGGETVSFPLSQLITE